MAIHASELKRWKAVCFNGLFNGSDMYASEMSFLTDMYERFNKYATGAHVSDKQADWLEKLEDKLQKQLGAEYEQVG